MYQQDKWEKFERIGWVIIYICLFSSAAMMVYWLEMTSNAVLDAYIKKQAVEAKNNK